MNVGLVLERGIEKGEVFIKEASKHTQLSTCVKGS